MQRILRFVAGLLDRVPSAWGIPLLVALAVLMWIVVLRLFQII